jgi:hypothetical protein
MWTLYTDLHHFMGRPPLPPLAIRHENARHSVDLRRTCDPRPLGPPECTSGMDPNGLFLPRSPPQLGLSRATAVYWSSSDSRLMTVVSSGAGH